MKYDHCAPLQHVRLLLARRLSGEEGAQLTRRQVSNLNRVESLPLSFSSIHWKGADCWLNNRRVGLFRAQRLSSLFKKL